MAVQSVLQALIFLWLCPSVFKFRFTTNKEDQETTSSIAQTAQLDSGSLDLDLPRHETYQGKLHLIVLNRTCNTVG